MNISFLADYDLHGTVCETPSEILGKGIDISAEIKQAIRSNGMIVKEVPCDQLLLVDTCCGYQSLKTVSSEYSFIMEDDKDLKDAGLILNELKNRKILVLTEKQSSYFLNLKERSRQSFYTPEGALINEKFARKNLSPTRMADAGLEFVGDSSSDKTQCYFHENHFFYHWNDRHDPVARHFFSGCQDFRDYSIPVLSSKTGEEIKARVYHVLMPEEHPSRHRHHSTTIHSHPGAPIKRIASKELSSVIDHAKLDKLKAVLEKKLSTHEIDGEYLDLLKQSLNLEHFSGLLREFDQTIQLFVDPMERYCQELQGSDVAEVKSILVALKSSPVKKETEIAVEKLANLEMVKAASQFLGHLPQQIQEAGRSAMESIALDDLGRFASGQSGRFFSDDFLNEMVSSGRLATLLTDNYFKSDKRNENLMQILGKGAELSSIILKISEKIHSLVEPYLTVE